MVRLLPRSALMLVLPLAACGGEPELAGGMNQASLAGLPALPPVYGLYAVEEDRLIRLDGDEAFERATWGVRSDLDSDIAFVVFDPSLADRDRPSERIVLQQVATLRQQVLPDGSIAAPEGPPWAITGLPDYRVPLDFAPVRGQPEMIIALPRRELAPALYSLRLREADGGFIDTRLGVDWNAVDQEAYASRFCVDYDVAGDRYYPCGEPIAARGAPSGHDRVDRAPAAPVGPVLAVQELRSRYTRELGEEGVLIEGVIVNRSDRPQLIPPLDARLQTGGGEILQRRRITLTQEQIAPNDRVPFRAYVDDPPTGLSNVTVTFVSESN